MISQSSIPSHVIEDLLSKYNVNNNEICIDDYVTGGNNEIFLLSVADKKYALKKYITSDGEQHDRLKAEWDFLQLLTTEDESINVPFPYAVNYGHKVALYSFIEGRKLLNNEVNEKHIASAMDFVRKINASEFRQKANYLNDASEASFSIKSHSQVLEKRINRLSDCSIKDTEFLSVLSEIKNIYQNIYSKLEQVSNEAGFEFDENLSSDERCLSPSDFGFHNILLDGENNLNFIDFEYAGWDDPAKLAADFFYQPEILVDNKYYGVFLDAAHSHIAESKKQRYIERAKIIRPMIGLRWCCIVLNPFIPQWVTHRYKDISNDEINGIQNKRMETAKKILTDINNIID